MKQATTKSDGSAHNSAAYATPALEKGLDVLELLAHQPQGLSKSQIARELNRTVSEIFRMLVCLRQRGYITQLNDDKYSLTLKLFKLAQEHPPIERLIADALPVMHLLAQDILQSCHMGVVEGGRVVFLAQVNAPTNLGFYVKLGSTTDLMEAASGYVLLAYQERQDRERMLAEWSRETSKKPPKDLEHHLAKIRKAGYEKRASYLVHGVVNISFPILDERGAAVAALTVPFIQYFGSEVGLEQVIEALQVAARKVTQSIAVARRRHIDAKLPAFCYAVALNALLQSRSPRRAGASVVAAAQDPHQMEFRY